MARTVCRLFSSSLRAGRTAAARSPRVAFARRTMSSESRAGHPSSSSDTPWMIGSALVFGPLFLYLVSPSARTGSHGHGDTHQHKNDPQHVESHREEDVHPIADDEGTEVSGQDVNESMEKAFEADSPKDAQEREEVVAEAEATAIADNSASETPPGAESTDTTPVPESNQTLSRVVVDDATPVIESAQTTAEQESQPTAESKV